MDCSMPGSLSITNSQSLLKLMSIESVMPSNHLILCRPLLLLPSIFPSIRVSSNESTLRIRWPKYWSSSFSIIPSKEHPGPISFTMDWLDLLAVQGTLKSLLQHHSSKASILPCSAFFMVHLSHPYMTTGKTIAMTIWNFISKVMSLLFNMLSGLVIAFLPRSKHRSGTPSRQSRGVDPPVQIRRVEGAQRKWCGKTSVFLLRETGMSGHFVGRIKGAKYRFDLQYLTWDFS